MQKGILIRTGGHILAKLVFAGNCAYATSEFERLSTKYGGFVVTLHDDTDPDFANAQVDMPGLIEER